MKAPVVFLQAFGRRDFFTHTPPERLWGWQRNVGLLIAILQQRGIAWKELYAPRLSEVRERASLFVIRDWRYPPEDVFQFCRANASTPILAMLFQCPQAFLHAQRRGEEQALAGITGCEPQPIQAGAEDGLFAAHRVIVRSRLNAALFTKLGYPAEKMICMPHAPVWTLKSGEIRPAQLGSARPAGRTERRFELLFIGDSLWRKGLVHLYRAFKRLDFKEKRLHVYNAWLRLPEDQVATDKAVFIRNYLEEMRRDPEVIFQAPYEDLPGLIRAHSSADLLACPSLLDCGPNVLMEAYQLGTPILASDLCGAVDDLLGQQAVTVSAPRWWERPEPPDAYTDRLALALGSALERPGNNQPDAGHVNGLLDNIVENWQALLWEQRSK